MWIHVISSVHLSVCLSLCWFILRDKNFKVGHYIQKFQPDSFILTLLLGIIDFFCIIPLPVTMILD